MIAIFSDWRLYDGCCIISLRSDCTCNEDETLRKAYSKSGDIRRFFEYSKRHDGVFGESPFVDYEHARDEKSEDDETDYGSGAPGVGYTAEFESEKYHDGSTDDE